MAGGPEAAGSLADRLQALREALPGGTRLLAVSKGQPADRIREAVEAGQRSFAESRLQEAMAKQDELEDLGPLDWHFIGRLQANKARGIVRRFGTVHSVDSLPLLQRLQRIALEENRAPAVLFQVRFRSDPGKTGFEPECLREQWPALRDCAPLRPVGLMTIPPLGLPAVERRAVYTACAALADELGLPERSMGMSGDWRDAVAAGSTWIRVGTLLFGPRPAAREVLPPSA